MKPVILTIPKSATTSSIRQPYELSRCVGCTYTVDASGFPATEDDVASGFARCALFDLVTRRVGDILGADNFCGSNKDAECLVLKQLVAYSGAGVAECARMQLPPSGCAKFRYVDSASRSANGFAGRASYRR